MDLQACIAAAADAVGLLAKFPLQWLGVTLVFFIGAEALMVVPYVGFVLKVVVAMLLMTQFVAMFAAAAAGQAPSPLDLLGAFGLPASSQAVLALAALVPFAAGMLFLYFASGPAAPRFFFGNLLKRADKPPAPADFLRLKYVLHLMSLPFALLPGAIALRGLVGAEALRQAISAAMIHWLPILLIALITLAFEWMQVRLSSWTPKAAAMAVGVVLTLLFVAWQVAIVYAVSAHAFPLQ